MRLQLKLDVVLNTVNADGSKSDVIASLERMLEDLVGMTEGAVDLQCQDTYMALTLSVDIALNLVDPTQSIMLIDIEYMGELLLGVYYVDGATYLNAGTLGLMQAAASGIDIGSFLAGFLDGSILSGGSNGLDAQGLVNNLLKLSVSKEGSISTSSSTAEENGMSNAIAELVALYAANASRGMYEDLTATEEEDLRDEIKDALSVLSEEYLAYMTEYIYNSAYQTILSAIGLNAKEELKTERKGEATVTLMMYNDHITVSPLMEGLGAWLGMENFPEFHSIVLSSNNFNTLTASVKIDEGNRLSVSIPDNGIILTVNEGVGQGGAGKDKSLLSILDYPSDLGDYGGFNGLYLSENGLATSTSDIINSLFDGLWVDGLALTLESRTDYWDRKDLYSWYPKVNTETGPNTYADDDSGYDGNEDFANTMANLIKVIKIISNVINLISKIAQVASGNVIQLINVAKQIYDLYKEISQVATQDFEDGYKNYPTLYRNKYSRAALTISKSNDNVIGASISAPSFGKGTGDITAHLENHMLAVAVTCDLSINLFNIYKLDIGTILGGNLLGTKLVDSSYSNVEESERPSFESNGLIVPVILFPDALIESEAASTIGSSNKMYGTVYDQDGEPISDATVMFTTGMGKNYTTTTDKDGHYAFLELPITQFMTGVYDIAELDILLLDQLIAAYGSDYSYENFAGKTKQMKATTARALFEQSTIKSSPTDEKMIDVELHEYFVKKGNTEYQYCGNGMYYMVSDKATVTVSKDGYTAYSKTGILVQAKEGRKALCVDATIQDCSKSQPQNITVEGTVLNSSLATPSVPAGVKNATESDRIGGLRILYNNGEDYATSSTIAGSTKGKFTMTLHEYAGLRALHTTDCYHNFDIHSSGYNLIGYVVSCEEILPSQYYYCTAAEVDAKIREFCTYGLDSFSVQLYVMVERTASTTLVVTGDVFTFVPYTSFKKATEIPYGTELYEYNVATNGYTLSSDVIFQNKKYYVRQAVAASDFEIWMAVYDGGVWKTIGVLDYADLAPDNFATGMDGNGSFSFTHEDMTLGKSYRIKFRSSKYQNINMEITSSASDHGTVYYTDSLSHPASSMKYLDSSLSYLYVQAEMAERAEHWSNNYDDNQVYTVEDGKVTVKADGFLQGLRIRLGADISDGTSVYTETYKDGFIVPDYNESELDYGMGVTDMYNNYTYIEAWIDSTKLNGILLNVMNLLWGMLGITEVTPSARISAQDISLGDYFSEDDYNANPDGYASQSDKLSGADADDVLGALLKAYLGKYNEADFSINDYIYQEEGAYYQAMLSANAKINAGLIHFVMKMVLQDVAKLHQLSTDKLSSIVGMFVKDAEVDQIGVLDLIAFVVSTPGSLGEIPIVGSALKSVGTMLGDLLMDLASLLSSILPLYTSYNMFDTYNMTGSPINAAVYKYTEYGEESGGTDTLANLFFGSNAAKVYSDGSYRVTKTYDRSAYAKITLNASDSDAYLDNIFLFLNGASFSSASETQTLGEDNRDAFDSDGNQAKDQRSPWNYSYWEKNGRVGTFYDLTIGYMTSKSYTEATETLSQETKENGSVYIRYGNNVDGFSYALYKQALFALFENDGENFRLFDSSGVESSTGTYLHYTDTSYGDKCPVADKNAKALEFLTDYNLNADKSDFMYFTVVENTTSQESTKVYTYKKDSSATYAVKGSEIRIMKIVTQGNENDFDGNYYNANGSLTTSSYYQACSFTKNRQFAEDWIASTTCQSYAYVDTYTADGTLYERIFIFDAYGDKYVPYENAVERGPIDYTQSVDSSKLMVCDTQQLSLGLVDYKAYDDVSKDSASIRNSSYDHYVYTKYTNGGASSSEQVGYVLSKYESTTNAEGIADNAGSAILDFADGKYFNGAKDAISAITSAGYKITKLDPFESITDDAKASKFVRNSAGEYVRYGLRNTDNIDTSKNNINTDYDYCSYELYDSKTATTTVTWDYVYYTRRKSQAVKDDTYQQVEIVNTGIDLRVVTGSASANKSGIKNVFNVGSTEGFYYVHAEDSSWEIYKFTPPTTIIFHDPYDLTDFTAIGGTWVEQGGDTSGRHNTDTKKTILDALPTRVYGKFTNGESTGTNGIDIAWDINALSLTPNGITAEDNVYLYGYIGNTVFAQIQVLCDRIDVMEELQGEENAGESASEILAKVEEMQIVAGGFTQTDDTEGTVFARLRSKNIYVPKAEMANYMTKFSVEKSAFEDKYYAFTSGSYGNVLMMEKVTVDTFYYYEVHASNMQEILDYLPEMFVYQHETINGGKLQRETTYIFNDLVWTITYEIQDEENSIVVADGDKFTVQGDEYGVIRVVLTEGTAVQEFYYDTLNDRKWYTDTTVGEAIVAVDVAAVYGAATVAKLENVVLNADYVNSLAEKEESISAELGTKVELTDRLTVTNDGNYIVPALAVDGYTAVYFNLDRAGKVFTSDWFDITTETMWKHHDDTTPYDGKDTAYWYYLAETGKGVTAWVELGSTVETTKVWYYNTLSEAWYYVTVDEITKKEERHYETAPASAGLFNQEYIESVVAFDEAFGTAFAAQLAYYNPAHGLEKFVQTKTRKDGTPYDAIPQRIGEISGNYLRWLYYYDCKHTSKKGGSSAVFNEVVTPLLHEISGTANYFLGYDGESIIEFTTLTASYGNSERTSEDQKTSYINLKYRTYGTVQVFDGDNNVVIDPVTGKAAESVISGVTDFFEIQFPMDNVWDFTPVAVLATEAQGTVDGILPLDGTETSLAGKNLASLGYFATVTINPLTNTDPYATLENVSKLNIRIAQNDLVIKNWAVLAGSFTAYENADGSSLRTYDSLNTTEQEYGVSYKICDNLGKVTVIKVYVRIKSANVVSLTGINEQDKVKAYQETSAKSATEQLLSELKLTSKTGVIAVEYDSGSRQEFKQTEYKVSYQALLEYSEEPLYKGEAAEGKTEAELHFYVKGVIYIEGDDNISYTVPYMNYRETGTYAVSVHIGKQGFTTTEMESILTELAVNGATNGINYRVNKVKASAYDALYKELSRYNQILLESYKTRDNDAGKADAWDAWYEQYDDSPADKLHLDMLLLKAQLPYMRTSINSLMADGYNRLYSSGKISASKITSLLDTEKIDNAGMETTSLKANVWKDWFENYTRSYRTIYRTVENTNIATSAASKVFMKQEGSFTVKDLKNAKDDKNSSIYTHNVYFNNSSSVTSVEVKWLDTENAIAKLNKHISYNGYVMSMDLEINDVLFGRQTVYNVPVHLNSVNVGGLSLNGYTDYTVYYNDGINFQAYDSVKTQGSPTTAVKSKYTYVFVRYSAYEDGRVFGVEPDTYIGLAKVQGASYEEAATALRPTDFEWYRKSETDNVSGYNESNTDRPYLYVRYTTYDTDTERMNEWVTDVTSLQTPYSIFAGVYQGKISDASLVSFTDDNTYCSAYRENVSLQVNVYDESTIDDFLNIYLVQLYSTTKNGTMNIWTEDADSKVAYANASGTHTWELATEVRADGRRYVLWRYVDDTNRNGDLTDDGLSYNGKNGTVTKVQVRVQSYGYEDDNYQTSNKWYRWVTVDLAKFYNDGAYESFVQDYTISAINGIGATVADSDKATGITISSQKQDGRYVIVLDPAGYDLSKPVSVAVTFRSGETATLQGTLAVSGESFYKMAYLDTTLTFGTQTNTKQTVKIRLSNKNAYTLSSTSPIVYHSTGVKGNTFDVVLSDETKYNWSGYDDLNALLPTTATVTALQGGIKTVELTLPVQWMEIEAYDPTTGLTYKEDTGIERAPTATAKIGNETLGYFQRVETLYIYPETFNRKAVTEIPNALHIDPYDENNNADRMCEQYAVVNVATLIGSDADAVMENYTPMSKLYYFGKEDYGEGENEDCTTKKMTVAVDLADIKYEQYSKKGFTECSFDVDFNVGNTVSGVKNSFEVRFPVTVTVTLWSRKITAITARKYEEVVVGSEATEEDKSQYYVRRIADGEYVSYIDRDKTHDADERNGIYENDGTSYLFYERQDELTGNMYNKINVDEYTFFVTYGSGNEAIELTDSIYFEGLEDIGYGMEDSKSGYVTACIGEGALKQTYAVSYRLTKSDFLGIIAPSAMTDSTDYVGANTMLRYKQGNNGYMLSYLDIEPFIGFVAYGTYNSNGYTVSNDSVTTKRTDVFYNGKAEFADYGLPEKMNALIETDQGLVVRETYVYWDYSAVQAVMSINGGRYMKDETDVCVRVTIFDGYDENGKMLNAQSMPVSVVVENRQIQYYEVSYDYFTDGGANEYRALDDIIYTTANQGSEDTYELLLNPYNLKNAMLDDYDTFYSKNASYSEDFDSKNFSYFRSVRVVCEGGYTVTYNLTADNYVIFDSKTKSKTDTSNLYAGKDVSVNILVGRSVSMQYLEQKTAKESNAESEGYYVKGKNGVYVLYTERDRTQDPTSASCFYETDGASFVFYKKQAVTATAAASTVSANDGCMLKVAPKTEGKLSSTTYNVTEGDDKYGDLIFEDGIKVRILDMSYQKGNGLAVDEYFIDPYGIISSFDTAVVYDEKVDKVQIVGADDVKYKKNDTTIVKYTFSQISYNGQDINTNYYTLTSMEADGTGKLSITYKRSKGDNTGKAIGYGGGVGRLVVTFGNVIEQAIGGAQTYDIPVLYVERTINDVIFDADNMPNYDVTQEAFVFDPYVTYTNDRGGFDKTKEQGYFVGGQYSPKLSFKLTAIDRLMGITGDNNAFEYALSGQSTIGLVVTDNNMTIKVGGGNYTVYAHVGEGKTEQIISFKVRILSRTAQFNQRVGTETYKAKKVDDTYYYTIGGTNYEIYQKAGITVNVFNGNLLTKRTLGGVDVWCLDEEKFSKALSVYDYIGQTGISDQILGNVLNRTSGYQVAVFYQDFDAPILYTMGVDAPVTTTDETGEGYVFKLTWEERTGTSGSSVYKNGLIMEFKVDTVFGLSYKGTEMRLYMKLPGYALGKKGQQNVYISIRQTEQYIIDVIPSRSVNGVAKAVATDLYTGDCDLYGKTWLNYFGEFIKSIDGVVEYQEKTIAATGEKVVLVYDTTWATVGTGHYVLAYSKKTGRFTVNSPYYFIIRGGTDNPFDTTVGGLRMPDYIEIRLTSKALYTEYNEAVAAFETVGTYQSYDSFTAWYNAWTNDHASEITTKSTYEKNNTTKYLSSIWSNASNNLLTMAYNDTSLVTAFSMSLDDQLYKMKFNVVPWLFADKTGNATDGPVTLFASTTVIGPDDIIMMPTKELSSAYPASVLYRNSYNAGDSNVDLVYNVSEGNVAVVFDEYYGYQLEYYITDPYTGLKNTVPYTVTVRNIKAGGTFRNNRNKWYFGNVDFYNTNDAQYATITFGGKGGQTLRYVFENVSANRTQINSNIPSVVVVNADNDAGYTLPDTYQQIFTGGATTPGYVYIPLSYTIEPLTKADQDEDGNEYFASGITLRGKNVTAATSYVTTSTAQQQKWTPYLGDSSNGTGGSDSTVLNNLQIAKIRWNIDCGGAIYPSNANKLTGTILAGSYGGMVEYFFDATTVERSGAESFLTVFRSKVRTTGITTLSDGKFRLYAPDTQEPSGSNTTAYAFTNASVSVPSTYSYGGTSWDLELRNGYYTNKNQVRISIKRGTELDLSYFPIMAVGYNVLEVSQFMKEIAEAGGGLGGLLIDAFIDQGIVEETRETGMMLPWNEVAVYTDSSCSGTAMAFTDIDTSKVGRYYLQITPSIEYGYVVPKKGKEAYGGTFNKILKFFGAEKYYTTREPYTESEVASYTNSKKNWSSGTYNFKITVVLSITK